MDASSEPSPASGAQVLAGIRVLDLSRWIAGEYATKLFADFGADVVKVEKPGEGSLTRHWSARPDEESNPEGSPLFLHLNTNKRSIELDLARPSGRAAVLDLARGSHAVVESFRPGTMERLGLSPHELRVANPALVVTRISPFGQSGPRRDHAASGLTLQAAGGPMNATGQTDREPLRKPGHLEHYSIGRMAAEATIAAIFRALRFGEGATVDVSGQEALLAGADRRMPYLLAASYSGADAPRGVRSAHRGSATFTGVFPAADGDVMIYVTNMRFWNRLVTTIADGDQAFLAKYLDRATLGEDKPEFAAAVTRWLAPRSKFDVMQYAQSIGFPVTAVLSMQEVRSLPHYRERDVFAAMEHPVVGRVEVPGAPWRMDRGFRMRRPAPLLGEHTGEVLEDLRAAEPSGSGVMQ